MYSAKTQEGSRKAVSSSHPTPISSQALEWVWQYLQDVRKPHVLDCGAVSSSSVRVFAEREAKIYVADLLAPLQRGDSTYWRRDDDELIFCLNEFLARLPKVPAASLLLLCCWHLVDLVPGDQVSSLFEFLLSLVEEGGLLFCFLREQNLKTGNDYHWRFETLTTLGAEGDGKGEFAYPPVTNREVEKLTEGYSLKTFLTRSHRREVVVLKRRE